MHSDIAYLVRIERPIRVSIVLTWIVYDLARFTHWYLLVSHRDRVSRIIPLPHSPCLREGLLLLTKCEIWVSIPVRGRSLELLMMRFRFRLHLCLLLLDILSLFI